MALSTTIKDALNSGLERCNLRIDTHTADRAELTRLRGLEKKGHFRKPAFPLLPSTEQCDPKVVLSQVQRDAGRFAEICSGKNDVGYLIANEYFTTPDAEVLYSIVQLIRPARFVEVGSGNSTRLVRQAIIDAELSTKLTSIDPSPRVDVSDLAHTVIRQRLEDFGEWSLFEQLSAGDILFVDSSHDIKAGNDVLAIVFDIMPRLGSGVLIHFHDVFLPYEYPRDWLLVHRLEWTEQYLIQALLTGNTEYEVIWPGYYLQQTLKGFQCWFAQWRNSTAQSFWLRKR